MSIIVRPASEGDLQALTRLDFTYPTDRYLSLQRSGESPEQMFSLRWRTRVPTTMAVYASYTVEGLRQALEGTDLFLVAESDGEIVGLLMIIVPEWTDAAEIADLAVDIAFRRTGGGQALVEAAAGWASEHRYRSLWVEPRADNSAAILFYASLGFRIAGLNDRLYSNRDHEGGKPTIYMHLELG